MKKSKKLGCLVCRTAQKMKGKLPRGENKKKEKIKQKKKSKKSKKWDCLVCRTAQKMKVPQGEN